MPETIPQLENQRVQGVQQIAGLGDFRRGDVLPLHPAPKAPQHFLELPRGPFRHESPRAKTAELPLLARSPVVLRRFRLPLNFDFEIGIVFLAEFEQCLR